VRAAIKESHMAKKVTKAKKTAKKKTATKAAAKR